VEAKLRRKREANEAMDFALWTLPSIGLHCTLGLSPLNVRFAHLGRLSGAKGSTFLNKWYKSPLRAREYSTIPYDISSNSHPPYITQRRIIRLDRALIRSVISG
jgi:hypothetical protein